MKQIFLRRTYLPDRCQNPGYFTHPFNIVFKWRAVSQQPDKLKQHSMMSGHLQSGKKDRFEKAKALREGNLSYGLDYDFVKGLHFFIRRAAEKLQSQKRAVMSEGKKYAKISLETRRRLIELVLEQKYSFKDAAAELGINQSTARMIVRKYQKDGMLFEKKQEHLKRVQVEKALNQYKLQKQKNAEKSFPSTPQPTAIDSFPPHIHTLSTLSFLMMAANSFPTSP